MNLFAASAWPANQLVGERYWPVYSTRMRSDDLHFEGPPGVAADARIIVERYLNNDASLTGWFRWLVPGTIPDPLFTRLKTGDIPDKTNFFVHFGKDDEHFATQFFREMPVMAGDAALMSIFYGWPSPRCIVALLKAAFSNDPFTCIQRARVLYRISQQWGIAEDTFDQVYDDGCFYWHQVQRDLLFGLNDNLRDACAKIIQRCWLRYAFRPRDGACFRTTLSHFERLISK